MGYEIHIDEANGIAYVAMQGAISSNEMMQALDDLAEDGRFVSAKRLWDVRQASGDLTPGDIERLAHAATAKDTDKTSRVAIVASADFVFGMSRIFEAHRASAGVDVRVFREIETAERWLLAADSS